MAFADERTVMNEIERLVFHIWETMGIQAKMKKPMKKAPFMHMTYMEAMACYGSDKPDLRYGARVSFRSHRLASSFIANLFLLDSSLSTA